MKKKYPCTDYHETNLDWVVEQFGDVKENLEASKKYHDDTVAEVTRLEERARFASNSAYLSAYNATSQADRASNEADTAGAFATSASADAQYVKASRDKLDLMENQLNTLIPSGTQTEGNTELIDVRTPNVWDNHIYNSAGDSVRGQMDVLYNMIKNFDRDIKGFKNLEQEDNIIPTDIINITNGTIFTDESISSSPYEFCAFNYNNIILEYAKLTYTSQLWLGVTDGDNFIGLNILGNNNNVYSLLNGSITSYNNAIIEYSNAYDTELEEYHLINGVYDDENNTFSVYIDGVLYQKFRFNNDIKIKGVSILDYKITEPSIINAKPNITLNDLNNKIVELFKEINIVDSKFNDVELDISELTSKCNDNSDNIELIVNIEHPQTYNFIDYNIVEGFYKENVPAEIETTTTYGFYSIDELIPVSSGQVIIFHNWFNSQSSDRQEVFCVYDSNRNPVNGGRVNFFNGEAVTFTDYKFIIPQGGALIGVSLKPINTITYDNAYIEIGERRLLSLTDKMNELVSNDTSKYYHKGSAPKKFNRNVTILCAGQSNAEGRCPVSQLPSYINLPMTRAYICKSEDGIFNQLNSSNYMSIDGWAFDLITYYYMTHYSNVDTFVIKKAMGGTSIDKTGATDYHWTADYEELDSISHSLLYTFESYIRGCLNNNANNIDIRAMLWHQGEGDYRGHSIVASDNYYRNLKNVISYIRGVVSNERLPFICGTISHNSAQYDVTIEQAFYKISSEDPYFYLVNMNNAQLLDGYHFNSAWSEYFGKKVYDYLIDASVVTGVKLNPIEPS